MRNRSFRAWMGPLSALTRLALAGVLVLAATACNKGSDNNNTNDELSTTAPVVNGYAASPSVITAGESCQLYWGIASAMTSNGAIYLPTTVSIDQGIGTVNASGTVTVSPTKTTTYTLSAVYEAGTIPGTTIKYGGGSTTATVTITVVAAVPGSLSVFAGVPKGGGNVDGLAAGACFSDPVDLAGDSVGNIYIADAANHTIRKLAPPTTPGGLDAMVSTLAGKPGQAGILDGTGSAARFNNPSSLAVDATGNLFVADTGSNTIRMVTPAGVVSTLAGKARTLAGSADGTGEVARFNAPYGIAVDQSSGFIYVADSYNHTIRKVTLKTQKKADGTDITVGVVSTLAGIPGQKGSSDSTDGTGATARFLIPTGLTVDGAGNLYVADSGNNVIRKVSPEGVVTTLAGQAGLSGTSNGQGAAARFTNPYKLAMDAAGNVIVADMSNHAIRQIAPDGTVGTLAGLPGTPGSVDGPTTSARFQSPFAVTLDASGAIIVADNGNKTIRSIAGAAVSTLAGTASPSGYLDATGTQARFSNAAGLVLDPVGNIYVVDSGNNCIRKIAPGGEVSTFVGAAAGLVDPKGIAMGKDGDLYVTCYSDHTVHKIAPDGSVSLLAGSSGQAGIVDASGAAARFNQPTGVAVDASGNVFVAEYGNHLIRKITPAGDVTTFAGHIGTSDGTSTGTPVGLPGFANGTGKDAYFIRPQGLSIDASGNLYVADSFNQLIRKVSPSQVVTTLAGTTQSVGFRDDLNASASFFLPNATAVDASGSVYVADQGNNTVRKITTDSSGHTTTIVGLPGRVINTTGPLPASIKSPGWVAVNPTTGDLYLTIQDAVMKVVFE